MSKGILLNLVTLVVMAIAAVVAAPYLGRVHWTLPRIAGAVLMLISLAVIVIARFQLGAAFSIQARAHHLVTTGLYSKIRNPIYVASPLFIVGAGLLVARWAFLPLALLIGWMQMRRAENEEQVLRAAFGEEYEQYRARTWF